MADRTSNRAKPLVGTAALRPKGAKLYGNGGKIKKATKKKSK